LLKFINLIVLAVDRKI